MIMAWSIYFACLCFASVNAINRPVYKIVLTQKGYAQFLQYNVETPPLREFTFCTWIRVYDLGNDQSIFTYIAKGNKRVMRLWLDTGGKGMKISINGKVSSSFAVDIVKDVWRHVCLSYQSDYGAWALYIDSRLVSCEAAQSLNNFILPKGGSIIVGYGTSNEGVSNGFEGEIFGANMILMSTIERNYTMRKNPMFAQKLFSKNKVNKEDKNIHEYIILSDLQTGEIQNNFEKIFVTPPMNSTKSYIKVQTPYSLLEHDVGVENLFSNKPKAENESKIKAILDYTNGNVFQTTEKDKIDFWTLVNNDHGGKFMMHPKTGNQDITTVAEYETPPPLSLDFDKVPEGKTTLTESEYKLKDSSTKGGAKVFNTKPYTELSEIETPPPVEKNTKVYGQWTNSKYAGSVLNYLKSINFQNRDNFKKVPSTIPLNKLTDSYPYASDFKFTKLRPPPEFRRMKIVEKRYDVVKKDPQINVQILEEDLRSSILKTHALTRPKLVEITNRGEPKKQDHRFYRNADSDSVEKQNSVKDDHQPQSFMLSTDQKKNNKYLNEPSYLKYKSVPPFLKSLEYLFSDSTQTETQDVVNSNDMYSKSFANANKWHNVKSYSNDFTPRRINMESEEIGIGHKQQHPAIRLKYKHEKKAVVLDDDPTIVEGRKLASEVSSKSNDNHDSISILKFNHGYLPTRDRTEKRESKIKSDSFNKRVKIGNALNEKHVLGSNDEQKKRSFVGGLDSIPDINRYRSDIDRVRGTAPSSLGPRVCKNVELYDRVLYVQQDESIDMTHILSPVKANNLAIEFILQNYKKCSLADSYLEKNSKLFIDWSKTPVRLFGGAYPRTTTDLCGFF